MRIRSIIAIITSDKPEVERMKVKKVKVGYFSFVSVYTYYNKEITDFLCYKYFHVSY